MKIDNTWTAVSSRIRLARNFDGYRFPSMARGTQTERKIVSFVSDLFLRRGGYELYSMGELDRIEKQSLVERYLISGNLASFDNSAVAMSSDKTISVMINEEDHVREQCILSGLDLKGAYQKILPIDTLLNRNFRFAKDGDLYLTSCPSNLGTGLRASVMMFLPALSHSDLIANVVEQATRLGITLRGAFGEGSVAEGYWYQISNSTTLGDVNEIINSVEQFVLSVSDDENDERYRLYDLYKDEYEDKCWRALGSLENCRLLSNDECVELISSVKLGNALGIIPLKNPNELDDLLVTVRPNTLQTLTDFENWKTDELKVRADYVRKAIKIIEN